MSGAWPRGLRALVMALAALALIAPHLALAQKHKKPRTPPRQQAEEEDEAPRPAPRPAEKPDPSRPFASAGYLDVPEGRDVRLGFPSGDLAIVVQGGSLLKRQNKALALDKGRMGVGLKAGGKAAIRVAAWPLIVETAGGKFVVERGRAATRLQVLEGKVLVTGAGPPRTMNGWQQVEVSAAGKVSTAATPPAQRTEAITWIDAGSKRR